MFETVSVCLIARTITALIKDGYLHEDDIDDDRAVGIAIGNLLLDMADGRAKMPANPGKQLYEDAKAGIAAMLDTYAASVLRTNS